VKGTDQERKDRKGCEARCLLVAQRAHRVDGRGAGSWNERGGAGDNREHERNERKRQRIVSRDAEQERRHEPREAERSDQADRDPAGNNRGRLSNH
jgi:hypothetical protein